MNETLGKLECPNVIKSKPLYRRTIETSRLLDFRLLDFMTL